MPAGPLPRGGGLSNKYAAFVTVLTLVRLHHCGSLQLGAPTARHGRDGVDGAEDSGAPSVASPTHRLSLAATTVGRLNASEGAERAFARQWLRSAESNCAASGRWNGPTLSTRTGSQALRAWLDLPIPETPVSKVKPAFLMMLFSKMVFAKSWESFFRYGGTGTSLLILHPKMAKSDVPEYFQPYIMPDRVTSRRCHDTSLMVSMMSLALGDRSVSHVVVISGDTLPLQPLPFIIRDLQLDARTRFCADLAWQRAETWFVMGRDHASLFSLHQQELRNLIPATDCEDEDLFYWPLAVRRENLANRCVMMTDWSDSEKAWRLNALDCQCPNFLSSPKDAATCARPATFRDVSPQGLDEIINSPARYWFARKFLGDTYPGVSDKNIAGRTTYNGSYSLDEEMARRLTAAARALRA
eukprot:TRINITY_DN39445_c0_g1_i1.p1 TRINITY_DN39445_c0_g1~~TRINITY_DN39445_c0_g1_i1.p1  ORF type:complete len:413 (+),score=65.10 TRINITY_DN39445_c0_g1_i1:55-1293(+)